MQVQSIQLNRGAHACHFFKDFSEQKAFVLPFFREGLENGEHCIYITSNQTVDDWCLELQAFGVDVKYERERGALQVLEKDAWRQPGDFNSILKAREAIELFEGLLSNYKAVRIAGDAAWAQNPDLPVEQLCHWEATANLVYDGLDIRAVCQYSLDGQSPGALHTALRTHRNVILGGRVLTSPYFEADRILEHEPYLNGSDADAASVSAMLASLG